MQHRVALLLLALLVAVAAGVAGCGGSDGDTTASGSTATTPADANRDLTSGYEGDERQAVAAAQAYVIAFSEGDREGVCAITSLDAAAEKKCVAFLASLKPSRQPRFEVASVKVNGNNATVLLKPTGAFGDPAQFKLRRVGGEWKAIAVSVPQ